MSKNRFWLISILFSTLACGQDHLQVGDDPFDSRDSGGTGGASGGTATGGTATGGNTLGAGDSAVPGAGGTGEGGGVMAGGAMAAGGAPGGGGAMPVGDATAAGGAIGAGGSSMTVLLSVCGNGAIEQGEQCDDANLQSFDGCNGICQIEADHVCPMPGVPCISLGQCGDGLVSAAERCDDGNTVSGDGCSSDCQVVERGWICTVPGKLCRPVCGDGVVTGYETCDDGNAVGGDGCSSTCRIEAGASCLAAGRPCAFSVCGNGVVEAGERCDCGADSTKLPAACKGINGALLGDGSGCTSTCTKEPVCIDAGGGAQTCTALCGDGVIDASEQCDDGNLQGGDGCSVTCKLEMGFTCSAVARRTTCPTGSGQCTVQYSVCTSMCGDGIVVAGEECDDGQANDDSAYGGCTSRCTLGPSCGDGKIEGPEQCDLGNANGRALGTGGCTLACTVVHYCGDGISDGQLGEECDLGVANGRSGSRCTAECTIVRH